MAAALVQAHCPCHPCSVLDVSVHPASRSASPPQTHPCSTRLTVEAMLPEPQDVGGRQVHLGKRSLLTRLAALCLGLGGSNYVVSFLHRTMRAVRVLAAWFCCWFCELH